ncbi:patatin-like phospholipase family protein [Croceibacterium sp. TMG7-5b_MA50]|uniref:patatin-like phospholipase family protein n=1 Tax=Croceibacterium sp. TMG7-5b_MA50 TaxID=3121290 RepID=UPI0032218132
MDRQDFGTIVLVLGGGNALGAYQAGVWEALSGAGIEPDWIVGTSIGAINGALIAGNAPERRLSRLTQFWQPATSPGTPAGSAETARRTAAVTGFLTSGRPGLYGSLGPLGSWWEMDSAAWSQALFTSMPLARSLTSLVDWPVLNAGPMRFTAGAVDIESGADVLFDTGEVSITPDHVRASGALMPAFPAIRIDGRVYGDGGLSANVPLDPVLGTRWQHPCLIIMVDLLPAAAPLPTTLGEAIGRAQDLSFAAQTRRSITRWQVSYTHDPAYRDSSVTLAPLIYSDHAPEVAGKALDFSPVSVRHRWDCGRRDAAALLAGLQDRSVGSPGLTILPSAG